MANLFRHCQRVAADRQTLLWISEQPIRLRTHIAGANAWIVAAIEPAVEIMPVGIIEPASGLAMLACRRRLTGEHTGRPSAVMGLQAQSVVRGACGQLQQSIR